MEVIVVRRVRLARYLLEETNRFGRRFDATGVRQEHFTDVLGKKYSIHADHRVLKIRADERP